MSEEPTIIHYVSENETTMVVDSRVLAMRFINETARNAVHASEYESDDEFYIIEGLNRSVEGVVHARLLELFEGYARQDNVNLLDSEDENRLTETAPDDDYVTREDLMFESAWVTMQCEDIGE